MQSRNKREGKLIGKHDGYYMRDKYNNFDGVVWSERFEPHNRKQWKLVEMRCKHNDFDYPEEEF